MWHCSCQWVWGWRLDLLQKTAEENRIYIGVTFYVNTLITKCKFIFYVVRVCVCIGVYVSLCVCVYLAGLWYPPGLVVEAGRVSLSDPVNAPAPRQHGLQRLSDWPAIRFFILQDYDQILDKNWQRIRPIQKKYYLYHCNKPCNTMTNKLELHLTGYENFCDFLYRLKTAGTLSDWTAVFSSLQLRLTSSRTSLLS